MILAPSLTTVTAEMMDNCKVSGTTDDTASCKIQWMGNKVPEMMKDIARYIRNGADTARG